MDYLKERLDCQKELQEKMEELKIELLVCQRTKKCDIVENEKSRKVFKVYVLMKQYLILVDKVDLPGGPWGILMTLFKSWPWLVHGVSIPESTGQEAALKPKHVLKFLEIVTPFVETVRADVDSLKTRYATAIEQKVRAEVMREVAQDHATRRTALEQQLEQELDVAVQRRLAQMSEE